jgi:hypothetical protein
VTDVFLSVRIPKELAEALAAHKKETGCPSSETVRRALRCWLNPDYCELCMHNPQPETIESNER